MQNSKSVIKIKTKRVIRDFFQMIITTSTSLTKLMKVKMKFMYSPSRILRINSWHSILKPGKIQKSQLIPNFVNSHCKILSTEEIFRKFVNSTNVIHRRWCRLWILQMWHYQNKESVWPLVDSFILSNYRNLDLGLIFVSRDFVVSTLASKR